jgi:heat shock protein HslJ
MNFRRLILGAALVQVVTATFVLAQTGALSTNQQVLTGSKWRLVSFGRTGAESPAIDGPAITIVFDNGRVSGSGGCNSYSGTYKV